MLTKIEAPTIDKVLEKVQPRRIQSSIAAPIVKARYSQAMESLVRVPPKRGVFKQVIKFWSLP